MQATAPEVRVEGYPTGLEQLAKSTSQEFRAGVAAILGRADREQLACRLTELWGRVEAADEFSYLAMSRYGGPIADVSDQLGLAHGDVSVRDIIFASRYWWEGSSESGDNGQAVGLKATLASFCTEPYLYTKRSGEIRWSGPPRWLALTRTLGQAATKTGVMVERSRGRADRLLGSFFDWR